jgi:hypothetical protein
MQAWPSPSLRQTAVSALCMKIWQNLLAASWPLVYETVMGPFATMAGIVLSTGQRVTTEVSSTFACAISRAPSPSERRP